MSALMPVERRIWIPVAAALALLLVAAFMVAPSNEASDPLTRSDGGTDSVPGAPEAPQALSQAKWEVKSFPARVGSEPSAAQKKAVDVEGGLAGSTVKAVMDALLLEPSALKELGGEELAPGVEAALTEARFSAPAGAEEVRITRRVAHIGVDPITARRASAEVSVGFETDVEGKARRYVQRSTLWLEKTDGKWQVIAFTGDRYEAKPKPDRKDKRSDGPGGKAEKKQEGGGG